MPWVADTGPLLHLYQAGLLGLLKCGTAILTTPTIVEEWRSKTPGKSLPDWVRVETPGQRALELGRDWMRRGLLDRGEAEALALAFETGAGGFLTDDTTAREFARTKGFAVRGSLVVVLMAAARNELQGDAARNAIQCLHKHSTLWISPALRRESKQALERILAKQQAV